MVFRAGIGTYFDQTQMNETQFITNGPPIFTQQNIDLTGRGLPEYEFGRNTLPMVTIPPIDENYITPKGTNLFAAEIDGRKPRVYMWTFSMQKSFWGDWLAEAAYVGSQGRRLSKRYNPAPRDTRSSLRRHSGGRHPLSAVESDVVLIAGWLV